MKELKRVKIKDNYLVGSVGDMVWYSSSNTVRVPDNLKDEYNSLMK